MVAKSSNTNMVLRIRNMESNCCVMVVRDELFKLGVPYKNLEIGRVELDENISPVELKLIDDALKNVGLEILSDNRIKLIEKVKLIIHQLVYLSDDQPKQNFSDILKQKINFNYNYISSLFSTVVGVKIEKYIITQKINRVKELLVYDNLSLIEITYLLKYSSVAHLSNQFKKETGMTPASFRQLGCSAAKSKSKK